MALAPQSTPKSGVKIGGGKNSPTKIIKTNKMTILYFDVETTGLSAYDNSIIQIAGIIKVDGQEVDRFNFKMQPYRYDNISEQAIATHGISIDQMKQFDLPEVAFKRLVGIFDKHVDKFNKKDKFVVAGYNVNFDVKFLRQFFIKNGNDYLFSYLGLQKDPYPVINYLRTLGQINPDNAKLTSMCEYWEIPLDNAHDALGDIEATVKVIDHLDKLLLK